MYLYVSSYYDRYAQLRAFKFAAKRAKTRDLVVTIVLDSHAFVGNFKMLRETSKAHAVSSIIACGTYIKRTFTEISLVLFKLHLFQ